MVVVGMGCGARVWGWVVGTQSQAQFTPDVHMHTHSHSARSSTGSMGLLHSCCTTHSECAVFEWGNKGEGRAPVPSSLDDKNMGWQEGGKRAGK